MSLPISTTRAFGFAAALALAGSTIVGAQTDTTRARRTVRDSVTSTERIPVRKDASTRTRVISTGEVVVPRDTVVRTDTVKVIKTDTVTVEKTVEVATPAPAPAPQPARIRRFGNGFYMGVGGGAAVPAGDFADSGFETGFNVSVPLGWQAASSPFGIRVNLGYNRLEGQTLRFGSTTLENKDPSIFVADLDATLRFPFGESAMTSGVGLYFTGGGGVYHFRDINSSVLGTELRRNTSTPSTINNDTESVTKWGASAGGGLDFRVGNAALFLESRFVNVFNRDGNDVRWVPIILGVKF